MDARPPGLHCHCYWLWLFPHATRETSVACLSCSWCGRCRLQEGQQGLPSVQEQQVSMFSFTSSPHECCGWPGPHLRVAAAALLPPLFVLLCLPACQPAHRCCTAPNSSRVAADLTWRFFVALQVHQVPANVLRSRRIYQLCLGAQEGRHLRGVQG